MTVTLCCSKKFKKQERIFAKKLRALGVSVYEPPLYSPSEEKWASLLEADKLALAAGFTYRHFHKIRKADAIFVLNVGGYIGPSANLEIGYAAALDKKIFFLEEEKSEYPRKILIDGVAKTPQELVKRLQDVQTPDILD